MARSPNDIAELFYDIVDDEPESTFELMDAAYTIVNETKPWQFLKKLDTSITHNANDTWQSTKTLPSDFGRTYRLNGGTSDNEYDEVPFDDIFLHINESNKYAIDMANSQMRLMGAPGSALTMYFMYLYVPTSLKGLTEAQKTSTSTIVWPDRFRPILAYKMAEILFSGVDADSVTREMAPGDRAIYRELKSAMNAWDNALKLKAMGGSAVQRRHTSSAERPDVLNW